MLRRTKGPHQPMSTPTLGRFTSDHGCNHDFQRKTNKNVTLRRRGICTITLFWGYCFELLKCSSPQLRLLRGKKVPRMSFVGAEIKRGVPAQQSDSFDLPHSMVLNLISLITVDMGWSEGLPSPSVGNGFVPPLHFCFELHCVGVAMILCKLCKISCVICASCNDSVV